MTLATFYLICFLVGFVLSLVSFLGQSFHFHGHVPHFGGHGGGGHVGHVGHAGHAGRAPSGNAASEISPLNLMTFTAFLAWFGGTGYLLERYSPLWLWGILALSIAAGIAGGWLVLLFLRKLIAHEHVLNPADYYMVGVYGHLSSPVREGGVGEMVFSQEGLRKAVPVRSDDGAQLEKGTEVFVTRYEKGIAYVRRWDEALEEDRSTGR